MQVSQGNEWLPPIFFLDFNSPCEDRLSRTVMNEPRKNTFVLEGTINKEPKFLRPSQDV